MYGEDGEQRYDRPASPRGVRIVIVILLVCGLALAALPLTVLLTGGGEPGRIALLNASGEVLHGVRVIRVVGTQERLVGSAHDLADGATTEVTFDAEGALRLRLEFDAAGGHHTDTLVLDAPTADDGTTRVTIGPGMAVQVTHGPHAEPPESSAAPAEPRPADEPRKTAAASAGHPLPEGWSDEWRPWFAHVDWVVGPEAGMAAARAGGKPMMMFYTATW